MLHIPRDLNNFQALVRGNQFDHGYLMSIRFVYSCILFKEKKNKYVLFFLQLKKIPSLKYINQAQQPTSLIPALGRLRVEYYKTSRLGCTDNAYVSINLIYVFVQLHLTRLHSLTACCCSKFFSAYIQSRGASFSHFLFVLLSFLSSFLQLDGYNTLEHCAAWQEEGQCERPLFLCV